MRALCSVRPTLPRSNGSSPLCFIREVTQYPTTSQIVIGQSAELEEHYHAQVKPKSINLFLFHKEGRYPIEPRENDFSLKGTRHFIPPDELQRIAAETPELSEPERDPPAARAGHAPPHARVCCRAVGDCLSRSAGTVVRHFGIVQPVLYPRASVTIVEERVQRVMEKFGLEVTELYGDSSRLRSAHP